MHHLSIIAILEHFADNVNAQDFKIQLTMGNVVCNCNGKIWLFQNNDIDFCVIDEDEQQITLDLKHNELKTQLTISFVYAKYKNYLRRPLRDRILQQTAQKEKPWCTVSDFYVLLLQIKNRGCTLQYEKEYEVHCCH